MSYPAVDLQKGLYDALKAGGIARVYDTVPAAATFPYVSLGEVQLLDDGNTCSDDMFEAFVDMHVWSRPNPPSSVEAKTVSGQVHDALAVPFAVNGWAITATELQSARHFIDSDGITRHSVISYRLQIEPA